MVLPLKDISVDYGREIVYKHSLASTPKWYNFFWQTRTSPSMETKGPEWNGLGSHDGLEKLLRIKSWQIIKYQNEQLLIWDEVTLTIFEDLKSKHGVYHSCPIALVGRLALVCQKVSSLRSRGQREFINDLLL